MTSREYRSVGRHLPSSPMISTWPVVVAVGAAVPASIVNLHVVFAMSIPLS